MNILIIAAILVGIVDPCSDRGGIDRDSYVESVRRAGDMPVLLCRTDSTEAIEAAVSRLDLLILTGGEDVDPSLYGESPSPKLGCVNAVRDRFETSVLAAAVRHQVPVFGVCRGMQLMNVFFGGTLYQDLPSEFAFKTPERHTLGEWDRSKREYVHGLEIVEGSRLAAICGTGRLKVNAAHHQAVKRLAPGFRVSAFSPGGVVEAIECDRYPAAGVQFHPEELVVCRGDAVWTTFFSRLRDFTGRRPATPAAASNATHRVTAKEPGLRHGR